jgi:hypothetical protein
MDEVEDRYNPEFVPAVLAVCDLNNPDQEISSASSSFSF